MKPKPIMAVRAIGVSGAPVQDSVAGQSSQRIGQASGTGHGVEQSRQAHGAEQSRQGQDCIVIRDNSETEDEELGEEGVRSGFLMVESTPGGPVGFADGDPTFFPSPLIDEVGLMGEEQQGE